MPLRTSPRTLRSESYCRQGFTTPSGVMRMRLQPSQKGWLTALIKPTRPAKPGKATSRAGPSCPAVSTGDAGPKARSRAVYTSCGSAPAISRPQPMGISWIKRTSRGGPLWASWARGTHWLRFSLVGTQFTFTFRPGVLRAASSPARARASSSRRVMA